MAIGLVFQVNVGLDFGQADIAFIESVMHAALREAGVPVINIDFDEAVSVGAPLETSVFDPSRRRDANPLGPAGPFGRLV